MPLSDAEKINIIFKKVFAGKSTTSGSEHFTFSNEQKNGRLHVDSMDVWSEAHLIPNDGICDITGSVPAGGVTQKGVSVSKTQSEASVARICCPFCFVKT